MTAPARRDATGAHLVSAGELATLLASRADEPAPRIPACVVVDCRFNLVKPDAGRSQYLAGHIPGARYAGLDRDLSGPRTADSGRHPLPDPGQLRALFGGFGIGPDTLVIAYDEGSGAFAARCWWLLRWLGHRHAGLLDGGLAAWERAGLPLTRDLPAPAAVAFDGQPGQMPTLDSGQVAAALAAHRIRLLDARAEDRFRGSVEPLDTVPGHVPGAINAPFAGNLGADGRFAPAAALAQRYSVLAGGRPVRDVVSMCGSGVTACHNLFALELAGMPGAALYPGSWSEWIRSPDRPVAQGP